MSNNEIQQTIIEISDDKETYIELGNNHKIPSGLVINNLTYYNVLDYIYSNLLFNNNNKNNIREQKYKFKLENPNIFIFNLYKTYKEYYDNEYKELITTCLKRAIKYKIDNFPEFKKSLLQINPNHKIKYLSEGELLGSGVNDEGYNLYGVILKEMLDEIVDKKIETKKTIDKDIINKLIYNIYVIYKYLEYLVINGYEILSYESKSIDEIIKIIEKDRLFKLRVPLKDIDVIISDYNLKSDKMSDYLYEEINRLKEIYLKDSILDENIFKKSLSYTFIYEIRKSKLDVGLTNLVKKRNDIILSSYFRYLFLKNYSSYLPKDDNETDDFLKINQDKVFEKLKIKDNGKEYQKLLNKIVDLYNLNVFDDSLQRDINNKLKEFNLTNFDPENQSDSDISEYESESDTNVSSVKDVSSMISSSIASTVNPIKENESEISKKQIKFDIDGEISQMITDMVFIRPDSVLSPTSTEYMINIDNQLYPSITHYVIKCRIEYIMNIHKRIDKDYYKKTDKLDPDPALVHLLNEDELQDMFSGNEIDISKKAYSCILYNTDFKEFDIENSNIGKQLATQLTSSFIEINSLNHVFTRIQYVLYNNMTITLLKTALNAKFLFKRYLNKLLETNNSYLKYLFVYDPIVGTGPNGYVNPYNNINGVVIDKYLKYGKVNNYNTDYTGKILMEIRSKHIKSPTIQVTSKKDYKQEIIYGFQNNKELFDWIQRKTTDIIKMLYNYNNYFKKYGLKIQDKHILSIFNHIYDKCIDAEKMVLLESPLYFNQLVIKITSNEGINDLELFNMNNIKLIWSFIYNIIYDVIDENINFSKSVDDSLNITSIKVCEPTDNCILSSIMHLISINKKLMSEFNILTMYNQILERDINIIVNIILSKIDENYINNIIPSEKDIQSTIISFKQTNNLKISDKMSTYILKAMNYIENYNKIKEDIKINRIKYFAYGK